MPKVLEERVKALQRSGVPRDKAYAVGTSALQSEGKMTRKKKKHAGTHRNMGKHKCEHCH